METIKGIIADIQRASIHDGYGVRTTVFFKGCPLSCKWCHNPECISFKPEMMFYPEKCIGCGQCDKGCFAGAKVICGQEMTPEEVLAEVSLDKDYYEDGGGVTFSGGEPFAQKDFLKECIRVCRDAGIGCAVETSLLYYDEEIFNQLDFVMADMKIWDSELHKQYTGVGNEIIKEHLIRLNDLGKRIIIRTPVIPEINQEIDKISEFLKGLGNVVKYELLPYHPLGNEKRKALSLKEDGFTVPTSEFMKEIEQYAFVR